jgi:flagellar basal-body rod protein FlgF
MSHDLYTSLSGAAATWAQMEVIANNLANVSTTGFKGQEVSFRAVGPNNDPLGDVLTIPGLQSRNMQDGSVMRDDNPMHFALQGEGFFSVSGGNQGSLTRDGTFTLDRERRLTTVDGDMVMGESGPIEIPEGETIRVDELGVIYGSESGEIDKFRIVTGAARQIGQNLWQSTGATMASDARVIQGALESSNVNPVSTMVELMEAGRYFESYQRLMQASDELDNRLNRTGGA